MTTIAVAATPTGWHVDVRASAAAAPLASFELAADGDVPRDPAGVLTAARVAATVAALAQGIADAADVHALGDYLFAALVKPAWAQLAPVLATALLVELALDFDAAPGLAPLPWELMRDGGKFLAAGLDAAPAPGAPPRTVDVAITRRVHRAPASYPPLAHPLRYLFALGTELGDPVRAGAEALGLLRQIGPAVRERIVQRQSLARLGAEINRLDPHVVHVICHGRDDGQGGVFFEMWNDEVGAHGAVVPVPAADVVDTIVRVRDGDHRDAPALAILSACSSGTRLVSAAATTGVAAALVARGVPFVVGMAGEIRDLASRLFTRCFGAAIVDRRPLIAAAVAGRRAALRSPALPADAFDWGLVQIFLGHDIDASFAVSACTAGSDEDLVMRWLRGSGLPLDFDPQTRHHPPLCGATDVLDGFARLVGNERVSALVLHAQPPRPRTRVGKRRAFAEVAALAIRAGHVPVIVMPNRSTADGYPTEPAKLLRQLAAAFKRTRLRMQLPPRAPAVETADPALPDAVLAALEADARALQGDAHAAHEFVRRSGGKVIVMLHDVHAYANAASLALELLATGMGAGVGEQVPVVLSWARLAPGEQAPDLAWRAPLEEEFAARLAAASWIEKVDIRPLEGTTASFAFQRVLLLPCREPNAAAGASWFLDLSRRGQALDRALRRLNNGTRNGCAGHFYDEDFRLWLEEVVLETEVVSPADDEQLIEEARR